ncbi:ATP-binding protein [Verrucomicrobiaceae bacterium 227]
MISIRWRLTLLLGLLVGVLLLATAGGIFLAMKNLLLEKFDETLTAKARALITASEIDGGEFEIDLTVKNFAGFGKNGEDFFEIRRADGSTFLRSPSDSKGRKGKKEPQIFPHIDPPNEDEAIIGNTTLLDQRDARYYVQNINPKGDKKDKFQDLYIIVASPTAGIKTELGLLGTVLVIASGTALLLMIPIIWFSLNRGLRPLRKLTADLDKIEPTQLDRRLDTSALPLELTPVATSLNSWLTRLEQSFKREREFTGHAAHELRTPLAELRMMAELGTMSPEEATPEQCAEMVIAIDELTALLEKLANLARSENGEQEVSLEPLSLPESVNATLARHQSSAEARAITFRPTITDAPFSTDPLLWRTILDNLINNAIDYSPRGSTITIKATPERLLVRNPAPNLEEPDLEKIAHRFWRKEHSRNSLKHSGLGLPIVLGYSSLLGGKCEFSLTPAGELQVEILWTAS